MALLPLRARLNTMSWIMRRVIAGPAGYRERARANLSHVWPDKSEGERNRIAEAAIDTAARTIIENYDVLGLRDRMRKIAPEGPGFEAAKSAQAAGKPVLFVTGHFGNHEAPRATLVAHGFEVGGLYRPMSNPYFNAHYEQNMHALSGPVFSQGRKGTMGLLRHLKNGGLAVLLYDVYDSAGLPLPFMGQPAPTLTSAAEIARKTGAVLIPFFGIRQDDGVSIRSVFEEPVPHDTPEAMMRELNARLERRIEEHPGQWFWIHRRWKPKRQARRQRKAADPKTTP